MNAPMLRKVLPLEELPGMASAFSRAVSEAEGKVCRVCGLARMGHDPETEWLGFEPHKWDGIPGDMKRADELSTLAYQSRKANCGHFFSQLPRCKNPATCSHVAGHCEACL